MAARSAPIAARIAWAGMRPLVTSWPPDRRTAEPNGAAHVFSHTSTAAELPGSSTLPISSTSDSAKHRKIRLRRAQLTDLAVVGIAQLRSLHRPVHVLAEQQQVQRAPHRVAVQIKAASSDAISPREIRRFPAGNATTR